MSETKAVLRKARVNELEAETELQAGRVRRAAEALRKSADAWFSWRGDGFDLLNFGQGIDKTRAALDAFEREHRCLLALLTEQGTIKGEMT